MTEYFVGVGGVPGYFGGGDRLEDPETFSRTFFFLCMVSVVETGKHLV